MARDEANPRDEQQARPLVGEQLDVHAAAPPDAAEERKTRWRRWRRWLISGGIAAVVLGVGLWYGIPWLTHYLNNVSTDDAYVSGHVSQISPRVAGYVTVVYVDDNAGVKAGDLLLELDHQPYQVIVDQKRAALAVAEANLTAARAQARAQEATARANWYSLVNAQEQVRYQVTTLRSDQANVKLQEAQVKLARQELQRAEALVKKQAGTVEEVQQRQSDLAVAEQRLKTALAALRRDRAALGLAPDDAHPTEIPADLEQTYSGVQVALSKTAEALAQIGVPVRLHDLTPKGLTETWRKDAPAGDRNQALDRFVEAAPAVLQARASRDQVREDLRSAELNLSYTYVYAPIDGQVNKRTVNPGNNVTPGQALLAVRSHTDVWVEANFRETQVGYLRIGQPVAVAVDAYGGKVFRGRVEGFAAATGAASALIPPENATGNFVKIVQRLPVRIALDPADLDPETPLFVGLSCVPSVHFKETPSGPGAGARLLNPQAPGGRSAPGRNGTAR